jgi:hypothetical protein
MIHKMMKITQYNMKMVKMTQNHKMVKMTQNHKMVKMTQNDTKW